MDVRTKRLAELSAEMPAAIGINMFCETAIRDLFQELIRLGVLPRQNAVAICEREIRAFTALGCPAGIHPVAFETLLDSYSELRDACAETPEP